MGASIALIVTGAFGIGFFFLVPRSRSFVDATEMKYRFLYPGKLRRVMNFDLFLRLSRSGMFVGVTISAIALVSGILQLAAAAQK